jgi:hypothetical protein
MQTPGDEHGRADGGDARVDQVYFGVGQRLVAEIEQASRAHAIWTPASSRSAVPTMAPILALRDELLQEAQEERSTTIAMRAMSC